MNGVAVAIGLLTCFTEVSRADVKVPAFFADRMVLQRDVEAPLWGTASANEKLSVKLNDKEIPATAGADGKWQVKLPKTAAGGPHQITITDSAGKTLVLKEVQFGEVWLASGQSNMHWTFTHNILGKDKELGAANDPLNRQFTVKKGGSGKPEWDAKGAWLGANKADLLQGGGDGASAVAYYFARELRKELKVPIGILNASVGGTPIQAWSEGGNLYNAMVHPLGPYAIRGFLWYQGESNCLSHDGKKYIDRQKAMIDTWRKLFKNAELPFYYVQIAPFKYQLPPETLPEFWEAQTALMAVPKCGMVVINDLVDNVNDIHPANKEDVGKRLARWALAKDYGQKDLVCCGPVYKSKAVEGNKMVLTFDQVGTGLAARGDKPLTHFEIAGEDKKFVAAKATITGKDTIAVEAEGVAKPVAVRFAWKQDALPNLANKEGLPASAFRTDDWNGPNPKK